MIRYRGVPTWGKCLAVDAVYLVLEGYYGTDNSMTDSEAVI